MSVHPAFDAERQVWVTERGVAAPSLRALQRKLPKAEIVGYYPDGFQAERSAHKPGDQVRSLLRTNYSGIVTTTIARRIDAALPKKPHKEDDAYWERQKAEYEAIKQGRMQPSDRFTVKKLNELDQHEVPLVEASVEPEVAIEPEIQVELEAVVVPEPPRPRRTQLSAPRNTGFWSEERDAQLKALVYAPDNYKAIQVAELMGCGLTKNAVIGRCHRLGYVLAHRRKRH